MFSGKSNQGVALITVLLIVALASIVATQMSARMQLQLQRNANIGLSQQAYWYAMGAEAFTKQVLIESFTNDPNKVHKGQIWAQGRNTFPVDYGQISGEIFDLQGCINLNGLAKSTPSSGGVNSKSEMRNILERLITSLNIEGVSSFEAEYMVDALNDWLDKDSMISSGGGAEDDDYSSREFPHLAANNLMASINELRVIEHFTPAVVNALKDYVCVIPDVALNKININTLGENGSKILEAIFKMTASEAENALSATPSDGYNTVAEFFAIPEMAAAGATKDQKDMFAVDSDYFILKTSTEFNGSYFSMQSIMKIENNKKISVIGRTVGLF